MVDTKFLKKLCCCDNQIKELNKLPQTLKSLCCSNNKIIKFDNLPKTLENLIVD